MKNDIEEHYCSEKISDLLKAKGSEMTGRITHARALEWIRANFGTQMFPDYTYYDGFHYGYKWVKYNGDYGEIWKLAREEDTVAAGCDTLFEATEFAIEHVLNHLT